MYPLQKKFLSEFSIAILDSLLVSFVCCFATVVVYLLCIYKKNPFAYIEVFCILEIQKTGFELQFCVLYISVKTF